ncbi:MAG: 5'-nucleotidase C-terminal domain-containing protein [Trueperaceae bacterium]|nr:5'-nucleotidase C-terminal domain-containing protein [Trueperaceae bacterium]
MNRFIGMIVGLLCAASLGGAYAQDTFSLQIIHSSDNESAFQDPNSLEPRILNYGAIYSGLLELAPDGNSLHITAGDHTLPGPFYQAASAVEGLGAPGLADIAIYNAMNLTANGLGNHEFDGGINDFARMLNAAEYPFIAANLDFSDVELAEGVPAIEIGTDGGSVTENAGKVVRSAYVEVGGERIGLIGRAPADFFNVINEPSETIPGLDFYGGRNAEDNQPLVSAVDQVLEQVDLLTEQGINKIILVDHAQDFTGDPLSARDLRGIDIAITAGSTGFMAQPEADGPFNLLRDGDSAATDYPTVRFDGEGTLFLVVNSDQLYRYIGHLIVDFDAAGRIVRVDPRSGPIATTQEAVDALSTVVGSALRAPAGVQDTFAALQATEQIQQAFDVVATTDSPLNGERADVRSRETNLGRLAADSTLWYARQQFPDAGVDIALKNGGGIRANITGPNIIRLSVESALAFDNQIAVVEVDAGELIATMENAVSRVPARDGRFPQLAGVFLEYDASREGVSDQASLTTPSRVRTLQVTRADGSVDVVVENFEPQGDMARTFVIATNGFLLTGGDGYQSLLAASEARGSVQTEIGEQQVLIEYFRDELGGQVLLSEPLENPRIVRLDEASAE